MEKEQLETVLRNTTSLDAWAEASSKQAIALREVLKKENLSSKSFIEAQINFLQARLGQLAARDELRIDIARLDETELPLEYRLGLLASFDITQSWDLDVTTFDPNTKTFTLPKRLGVFEFLSRGVDELGDPEGLSSQPISRGLEIGNQVSRLRSELGKRNAPILMLWRHEHASQSYRYTEAVEAKVEDVDASFPLSEPQITDDQEGSEKVEYTLPTKLKAVSGHKVVVSRGNTGNQDLQTPDIPALVKLTSSKSYTSPNRLVVGKSAVTSEKERVVKEEENLQNYRRAEASYQASRRRRRPAVRRFR